jgi:serine/threonine protein phosphatase PrpC
MPPARTDYKWGVIGHSQIGASHTRQGIPNQDAIRFFLLPDGSPPIILAVADGHGSAKSFRSHVGATLAVETAVQVLWQFFDGIGKEVPSAVKGLAKQLPGRVFQKWRERVRAHHDRRPFTDLELARLGEEFGTTGRNRVARGEDHLTAYGTTLLAALLTNDFLFCFQLGDGEILTVTDGTCEVVRAVEKDPSLIANETTSLSQTDAELYVRPCFQRFQDRPPGLILLTTDGYPNSFVSQDAFLKAGSDYLDLLSQDDGPDIVEKNLPSWLEETSREGSGDDITLGIVYRREPRLLVAQEDASPAEGVLETGSAAIGLEEQSVAVGDAAQDGVDAKNALGERPRDGATTEKSSSEAESLAVVAKGDEIGGVSVPPDKESSADQPPTTSAASPEGDGSAAEHSAGGTGNPL